MSTPDLSVVLVAPLGMETIGRTMACLRAQTAAARMEVLLVTPEADALDLDALGRDRFAALRPVEVGSIEWRGEAAAEGIRRTTAPIVALIEDHSFPRPRWAEALLGAHASGDWVGVGPRVYNANPEAALSAATYLWTYASLSGLQEAGPVDLLAWHNTAYRREALLAYGDRLGPLLEWEGHMQADLIARGHRLYLDPRAETDHLNVSGFGSAIKLHFLRGRMMGGHRAEREGWPVWRRALYAVSFPLFPVMQWRHIAPDVRRSGTSAGEMLRLLPAMVLTVGVGAVGEAVGYLAGEGDSAKQWRWFELYRSRYLTRRERRLASS